MLFQPVKQMNKRMRKLIRLLFINLYSSIAMGTVESALAENREKPCGAWLLEY